MNKFIPIIIITLLLAGVSGYFLLSGNYFKPSAGPGQPPASSGQPPQQPPAGGGETNKEPEEKTVTIQNFSFNPADTTVKVGTIVTWENKDSVAHTVTSQGNFDSGTLAKGQAFSYKFEKVGEFNYHCVPHPYMKARVTVVP